MKLNEIKALFNDNLITKDEYIKKMHDLHESLFDYSEFLQSTDISKILIENEQVTMVAKGNNIKMICNKHDLRIVPIEILNFGTYEKEELSMLLKLVGNNDYFFDIGANIGWVSMNVAETYKNSKVFAFEPIPKTFEYLRRNVKLNNINNIYLNNFGFSNEEKEATFYYCPKNSVNASLENVSNTSDFEKIICDLRMLDEFVINNNLRVDFIKCDVEGAELFVFQGGIEAIKKFKPIVLTEMLRKWAGKFNYHPNDIIKLFSDIGYRCFITNNEYLKEIFYMDEKTSETNFFFLNNEKHSDVIAENERPF